jgi:hypothetical protein
MCQQGNAGENKLHQSCCDSTLWKLGIAFLSTQRKTALSRIVWLNWFLLKSLTKGKQYDGSSLCSY